MTTKNTIITRLGAIMLAVMLVAMYCIPTSIFAAGTGEETGKITVANVDKKATKVTAFKIVESKIKDGKVVGYQAVKGTTGVDKAFTVDGDIDYTSMPDKAKLAGIIPADNGVELEKTLTEGEWEKTLKSGIYLIQIKTDDAVVYNPIIVGLSYSDKDNAIADEKFNIPQGADAKKQPVKVIKEATKDVDTSGNKNGQDAQVGDEIEFKITAPIANYSDKYNDIKLELGDTLDKGLTFVKGSVDVTIPNEKSSEIEKKITKSIEGQKLTVNVKGDKWIKANGGNSIVVTYKAKLNENAKVNFDSNKNSVEYIFSNNPYDSKDSGISEDHTYHYTFEIDGVVGGTLTEKSHEFIKTGDQIEKQTSEITTHGALKGADFALYDVDPKTNEDASPIITGKTDEKGLLEGFKGLDANKTYYLVEISAPAPYMVNDAVTKIKVNANYNEDGTLKDYQFVINDNIYGQKFTATYQNEAIQEVVIDGVTEDNHFEFVNSKTPKLPSTGGIGTYIFTILGVAIIAIAVSMYFRKKNS